MASSARPHALVIPYPAQGHITPMLHFSKLLHLRGFHITFVHTEYNHRRMLRSNGPSSLDGLPDFRFDVIPDGLPPSELDVTQDIPQLCLSTRKNCGAPLQELILKLNGQKGKPPVTCVVADSFMTFTVDVAKHFGVPVLAFVTLSACGFMSYLHFSQLIERGYAPLKGEVSVARIGFLYLRTSA